METPITAKAALLQALLEGPGYPAELVTRVEDRTNGQVKLGQGSVYPALKKFVEEGLVETYKARVPTDPSEQPHDFYSLTADGKKLAQTQRKTLVGLVTPRKRKRAA